MSGEQQLERSVLDGKERDELLAIAEAMGLKPAARVAKSTLVTQIVQATVVEVGAEPPARRARAPRKAANGNGNGAGPEADVATADAAAATGSGSPSGTDTASEGGMPALAEEPGPADKAGADKADKA